jgi:hypothetical protein
MKRTALKRSVKPMAKRSARRGSVEAKDAKWRADVKTKFGPCCRVQECLIEVAHTHHVLGKNANPRLRHVVENGARLCEPHHCWAHKEVETARAYFINLLSPTDAAKLQQLARQRR